MVLNELIKVEVAYALPDKQYLLTVLVAPGSTIAAAIECSGILTTVPAIDLTKQKVGVFSKPRLLTDKVEGGDRIEIYRPLIVDPKEARRVKAKKS